MYFISRKKGDKYGVVDTKDWVEEFYTVDELKSFEGLGLKIEKSSVQSEMLSFIWSYIGVLQDCGGSVMDLVDSFLEGTCSLSEIRYEVGGSTLDVIEDLKSSYTALKAKWTDLDVSTFTGLVDDNALYYVVSECLNHEFSSDLEDYVKELVCRFHFKHGVVKRVYGYDKGGLLCFMLVL